MKITFEISFDNDEISQEIFENILSKISSKFETECDEVRDNESFFDIYLQDESEYFEIKEKVFDFLEEIEQKNPGFSYYLSQFNEDA